MANLQATIDWPFIPRRRQLKICYGKFIRPKDCTGGVLHRSAMEWKAKHYNEWRKTVTAKEAEKDLKKGFLWKPRIQSSTATPQLIFKPLRPPRTDLGAPATKPEKKKQQHHPDRTPTTIVMHDHSKSFNSIPQTSKKKKTSSPSKDQYRKCEVHDRILDLVLNSPRPSARLIPLMKKLTLEEIGQASGRKPTTIQFRTAGATRKTRASRANTPTKPIQIPKDTSKTEKTAATANTADKATDVRISAVKEVTEVTPPKQQQPTEEEFIQQVLEIFSKIKDRAIEILPGGFIPAPEACGLPEQVQEIVDGIVHCERSIQETRMQAALERRAKPGPQSKQVEKPK